MIKTLDHVAIAVEDTNAALAIWRDQLGLRVVHQEIVNNGAVMLTHLDMGNAQLQLVQPLCDDSPLVQWLEENGTGLHHLCFSVEDIESALAEAVDAGLANFGTKMHQGTQGKRAVFLNTSETGATVEFTGF